VDGLAGRMKDFGIEIVDAGLVDTPDKAIAAAGTFSTAGVDAMFLYVSTYALSHTVLPVVQRIKVHVIVLGLQPQPAMDYASFNAIGDRGPMTGEWLANCQACALPEIAYVFLNSGIDFRVVTGWLEEGYVWDQIGAWIAAVGVRRALRDARIGILGHYYCGMLDVYTDVSRLAAVFGSHFELLEMDRLKTLRDGVGEEAVERKLDQFRKEFSVSTECEYSELHRAARTSCALDALISESRLGALAYYDQVQRLTVVNAAVVGNNA
jgi:L-arabinose isomerase